MSKTIIDYAAEWQEKLQHCQYAGEIYIDEHKLTGLSREFIADENLLKRKGLYNAALLVLAVNCAYHYYDDEGFWIHFCTLLKCSNNPNEHYIRGTEIESYLKSLGLLRVERSGPFRFVGTILEHCGVSRRYIVPFAHIIRQLISTMGRDRLFAITRYDLNRRLESMNCSAYLKNFLLDNAGWDYFQHVSQLIRQYESRELTIEDLNEITGFQPGFWSEFIGGLGIAGRKYIAGKFSRYKPKIVFLSDERCIGLQFPFPEFIRDVISPSELRNTVYPVTRLDKSEYISKDYSGRVLDTNGQYFIWNTNGWVPDGLPVLFDKQSRLIEKNSVIVSGTYILLAPIGYNIPYKISKQLGSVKLPGPWKYIAYKILLTSNHNIPEYSMEKDFVEKHFELSWINPESKRLDYCNNNYFDVFTGSLPELNISDFSMIEQKVIGLFYDLGDGPVRIKKSQDLINFYQEAISRVPLSGQVWFKNLSRGRVITEISSIDGLQFILFPECRINFEERVYGFNEKPSISIEGNSSCMLELKGCQQIENNGREWSVPVNIKAARGFVICKGIKAGIQMTVYRAGMQYQDGRNINYISLAELQNDINLNLTGYPERRMMIILKWDNGESFLETEFDIYCRAELNSRQLFELVKKGSSPVYEIYLAYDNYKVSIGTVLIDLEALKNKVYDDDKFIVDFLSDSNIESVINLCTHISRQAVENISFNRFPQFSSDFNEWFHTMLGCAIIFDGTIITSAEEIYNWRNKITDAEIRSVLTAFEEQAAGLAGSIDINLERFPAVTRWQNCLKLFQNKTKEVVPSAITQWSEEIKHARGPLRSEISLQQGGNLLGQAWRLYLAGNYGNAINIINTVESGSNFIIDLKKLLHILLLLRINRISAAGNLIEHSHLTSAIAPVYGMLVYAIREKNSSRKPDKETLMEIIQALPLSDIDRTYIEKVLIICIEPESVIAVCQQSEDWLLIWTAIRLTESREVRTTLAQKLLANEEKIPGSPDRGVLLEEIRALIRGNFNG